MVSEGVAYSDLTKVTVHFLYSALYFTVARSAEGRLPAGRLHCLGFSASAFPAPFSGQREVASALKI